MKTIDNLLEEELHWKPTPGSGVGFVSGTYKKEECHLKMNNFPEEPLWTLFYNNESIDFDETPKKWTVKYLHQM